MSTTPTSLFSAKPLKFAIERSGHGQVNQKYGLLIRLVCPHRGLPIPAVVRSLAMTDERFMKLVGKRVRQLRLQKGLTQDDMPHHFEYRYYQRIEHGDRNISLKILNRLSKALGVPAMELFRFD